MPKKIFVIAGEASGDVLGGKLISAIKKQSSENIEFFGVGGENMHRMGVSSIFPMEELSLIGFIEIIPHIPKLLGRINQVVEEVRHQNPDLVITIDAPAFNFRVAKKIRQWRDEAGEELPKLVHYVAPTVWAYKPKRAHKIAKIFDHLLLLLPFEPPYFDKVGLENSFIGHPIVEGKKLPEAKQKNGEKTIIGILPGSRSGEIKRLLPVIKDSLDIINGRLKNLEVILFSTERFQKYLQEETASWSFNTKIVSNKDEKERELPNCDLVIAKSGTATLEVAMAGAPMIVIYKVNQLSAWLLKRMIKVKYVNLINLIADEPVIPELLQEDCNPQRITETSLKILDNPEIAKNQCTKSLESLKKLGFISNFSPSERAAKTVLDLIQNI